MSVYHCHNYASGGEILFGPGLMRQGAPRGSFVGSRGRFCLVLGLLHFSEILAERRCE